MRLEHQEKLIKDAENEAARQRQQEAEEEKLAAKEAAAKNQPKKLDLLQYLLVRDLPIFSKVLV